MNRYVRQIAVPQFGPQGQARLQAARLLVVGAGGLAAPLLPSLVGAGAGFIRLVDPDRVELSNLHRQTLFRMADIGRAKVEAAVAHMQALNPDCVVEPVREALDPANAAHLAEGIDVMIDCADSFAASYILSDRGLAANIPLISASVIGISGYVGGFCGGAPSLRAVFPDLPPRLGNCAEDGVLPPVVALIGALQAQMALAVVAGDTPSPLGRLVTFDTQGLRFGGFRFDGADEPSFAPRFIAGSEIGVGDFVVDLREPDEAPLATPLALRLRVEDIGSGAPLPESGQRAVLCCRTGLRSWRAAERLRVSWGGEIVLAALGRTAADGRATE